VPPQRVPLAAAFSSKHGQFARRRSQVAIRSFSLKRRGLGQPAYVLCEQCRAKAWSVGGQCI